MKLAKFTKDPTERLRYVLDYSQWLGDSETIISAYFSITPAGNTPLVVDASSVQSDGLSVVFYASSGLEGGIYYLIVSVTTSNGQVKADQITFVTRAA